MKLIQLNKDSFVRRYENIGYVYNQSFKNDLVLDEVGAEFLLTITKQPTLISDIVNMLHSKYSAATKEELAADFTQFTDELEKQKFVTIWADDSTQGNTDPECDVHSQPADKKENVDHSSSREYLKQHFCKFPRPFRAHVELTSACNLRCVHCYISPNNHTNEISKRDVYIFLDQLEAMGTMEVIFTGGEALLHRDIIEILSYARQKDFSVTLLTNGVLIDKELAISLEKLNLALVQISLYSMSPSVHDKITGLSGSWGKTKKAINTLIQYGVKVEIACPVIKENEDSFQTVTQYGNSIGVSVSNDLAIMARSDFSRDNLDHRLAPQRIRYVVGQRSHGELDENELMNPSRRDHPDEPVCGMGYSLICLSSNGDYHPCPGFELVFGNIHKNTVEEVWKHSREIIALRKINNASFTRCMKCEFLDFCAICPAKFYNESGGDLLKVDCYFCEIAKAEKHIFLEERGLRDSM